MLAALFFLPLFSEAHVEAVTLDRGSVLGELVAMGPDRCTIRSQELRQEIPHAEILRLRWPGRQSEKKSVQVIAELWNGDWVRGNFQALAADRFSIRLATGSAFEFRLEALRRLVFPKLAGTEDLSLFQNEEGRDRLYLRKKSATYDYSNGTFESFEGEQIAFRSARGQVDRFGLGEVAALVLAPLEVPAESRELLALIEFRDGSQITGRIKGLQGDRIEIEGKAFGRGAVEMRELLSIRFKNGKYVFLSDLEPSKIEQTTPFGSDSPALFPYQKNRSVGGNPLRVADVEYAQGLGVHSRCVLHYSLKKGYRTFRASVGIDDEVRELFAKGSVIFRVRKDETLLYESPVIRGGMAAIRLPDLDVSGAETLILEADYADDLHVADRADWLDPLLIP